MLLAAVVLSLAPWHGPSLPTVSADAIKYKLSVRGAPRQSLELRASGLPDGWVASFCTSRVCSPSRYTLQLDRIGQGTIEFQAIRVDDSAPAHVRVTVSAPDANTVTANITKQR